ncbi:AfsR/SARP family transcriptional regulator [Actinocrispum sp. NPDC049592]|uniref:AfsR/SARP family transcriptional regulator n=1 Tax=Actinocrispum sp. NPDC049592 TaxID=3154835 RepID=UPI00341E31B6
MRVQIEVLGSLTAMADGVSFVPSASKPRQLLAMLAVNAGKVVTVTEIMAEIWGEMLPRSASHALHTYLSSLRRALDEAMPGQERASRDILVTEHAGYALNIDPSCVDANRYHEQSNAGRWAADRGDYAVAAESLRTALEMWRGPALNDVTTGSHLEIEVLRLEETRLADLELCIDAELHLRRHRLVLGELAVLCARNPLFENFHAQHMLALYRTGRQSHALDVYRRFRNAMVSELGVDPSPRLRQLHQSILAGDPVLDDPGYVSSGWVPTAVAG